MGREIRRVPPDWEHPRTIDGSYLPLFDRSLDEAEAEWDREYHNWRASQPQRPDHWQRFIAYYGDPPSRHSELYRPGWTEDQATHYQVYENVSEGTPVSPVLPTTDAVVEWLVEHGAGGIVGPMTRQAAEKFVGYGSAPSLVIDSQGIRSGAEAMGDLE